MSLQIQNKTDRRKLSVKFAENGDEIDRALALRYTVFNTELNEGLAESRQNGKDRDPYDQYCDHLIVIDRTADEVVGTYRLMSRETARDAIGFYSETEFDLSGIHALDGGVVELGRSCVHSGYRDGSVITLLWKGIATYLQKHDARYLIGCASIHRSDPVEISQIYSYLRESGAISDTISVSPLPANRLLSFDPSVPLIDEKQIRKIVPPLLKGYLRAGAKICGNPAFDPLFRTTDFFILFDVDRITERYGKRFL